MWFNLPLYSLTENDKDNRCFHLVIRDTDLRKHNTMDAAIFFLYSLAIRNQFIFQPIIFFHWISDFPKCIFRFPKKIFSSKNNQDLEDIF